MEMFKNDPPGGASAELSLHRHGAESSLSARERAGAARKIENWYPKSTSKQARQCVHAHARITVMMRPSTSGLFASFFLRRSLVVQPFQHLPRTLPSLHSSPTALALIVGASLLDEPLQDLEVTTLGCSTGRSSIPRTALAPRPAQDLQVTMKSSIKTNT